VDVRGRSRTLRVNYRTSHQIRTHADHLLAPQSPTWTATARTAATRVSVFNGPLPLVQALKTEAEEIKAVRGWIAELAKAGVAPHEFGVFVRSEAQLARAEAAVKEAGLAFKVLDEHVETPSGHVAIGTMHLAKGLEFRAVAVMACDDEVVPLQERIESVGDDADLQEIYDTERHLLYVGVHPSPRSSAGHGCCAGVGIPRRFRGSRRGSRAQEWVNFPTIVLSSRLSRHEVATSFFG
jgi:superfamily I DNA/RNA helicase